MTRQTIKTMGLLSGADREEVSPQPARRAELEAFHLRRYLDVLQAAAEGILDDEAVAMGLNTPDCPVFPDMYDYPALACGATMTGARLILDGHSRIVFNPSGGFHHAGPARAAGFCYLNDIVLGCMTLADAGKRVMVVDIDVHHGDGVQDAFYERRDVMTMSFHESGRVLFPGTGFESEIGRGEGEGFAVNVPLPVGTYDEAYVDAFDAIGVPLIGAFDPDVIVFEIGMDALAGDPLAHLHLTNNAYAEVVERVMRFGKPILATGGGGYHVENAARGWALVWSVLCGEEAHDDMAAGAGGVLMESREWQGGLRDRALISDGGQRRAADAVIDKTIDTLKRTVFPLHGL
jgi:acetoin utilization protein AcuC